MRKLTRFISAIVIVCCLCSLVSPVYAANFTDVSGLSTEFRDAINYLYDNGIMNGTSTTQFSPDEQLTRAMVITLLYRLSGDTGTYTCSFPDVPSDKYYYNAVGWGVSKGIITGHTDGTFHPYDWIKFEDFCAFLHRYAKVYNASTTGNEDETELASAPDFSTVYEYAKDAMCWFFSWGLKDRNSSTEALNPKAYVTRKYAALALHRYRLNVEGIVFGRDNFSFKNHGDFFVSSAKSRYCISSSDYILLRNYAQSVSSDALDRLTANINNSWEGSCYGMSLAVILDYLGKIDLNGNFCTGADTMYQIPTLKTPTSGGHHVTTDRYYTSTNISKVESKINMYQLSQFVFHETASHWSQNSYYRSDSLLSMVEALEHSGIGLFTYSYSDILDSGHAVVAYGKPVSGRSCTEFGSNGCTYHINLYDPNRSQPATLHIVKSGGIYSARVVRGSDKEDVTYCKFEKDFDIVDNIDIDSDNNILSYNAASTESVLDEYNILFIQASGEFAVTNAEGESFHFSRGEVTGSMEVYGFDFIVPGDNVPCELMFLVDPSSSYTCVVGEGAQLLAFHFLDSEDYLGGTADKSDSWAAATISSAEAAEIQWIGADAS